MPSQGRAIEHAVSLMRAFAERTGLDSDRPQRRYLWTDAFAVCNYLALARATREERYTTLALRLVDQVHHVLGRHRPDEARTGWLSGQGEREGEAHPTLGGLRIGKALPERAPGEPVDQELEWNRDGQYFHYLTKWMHALDQVSRSTGAPRFNLWARELARVAHAAFVYRSSGHDGLRMIWKASVDLSRPLVASMGQHDPLDGLVTCAQLEVTAKLLPGEPHGPVLDGPLSDFAAMVWDSSLVTADPLGLGGLMMDAGRVAQLMEHGVFVSGELLGSLVAAAVAGLSHYERQRPLLQPATRRLAFRELGLAIGLHALELVHAESLPWRGSAAGRARFEAGVRALRARIELASEIEAYWLEPAHRAGDAWHEHRDINEVMLATSLVPRGFLVIAGPR